MLASRAFQALVLLALCDCAPSPADRMDAKEREARKPFETEPESTRATFSRLPACPAVDAGTVIQATVTNGLAVPGSFRRDTGIVLSHGGARFRSGDTDVVTINGHYGLSSFTGRSDGLGEVPDGCSARIGGRVYLVTERFDGRLYWAQAIELTDTSIVYGNVDFVVTAPRSVRRWLLELLAAREHAP